MILSGVKNNNTGPRNEGSGDRSLSKKTPGFFDSNKAPGFEPNPGKRKLRKKASCRSIEATGGFLYGKALLERNTTKGNGNEGSRIYAQANWRGVGI